MLIGSSGRVAVFDSFFSQFDRHVERVTGG